jgi:phosphoribosylamine--glycine ligase
MRTAEGALETYTPTWTAPCSLAVVLGAQGYPGEVTKGDRIRGLAEANAVDGVTVFHAGTALEDDVFVTHGGRVLTVTATGSSIDECAERAYRAADQIEFTGKQYRRDIGHHARGQAR